MSRVSSVLFIVLFMTCAVKTNRIRQIDIMTSNCDDCGMSQFGDLSIKVKEAHLLI